MPTLVAVEPLEHYRLRVKYSDGVEGVVDLSGLVGQGVFALWNDEQAFRQAHIDPAGGIAWNDEVDICADAVYLQVTGKKPEDVFPNLREALHYA